MQIKVGEKAIWLNFHHLYYFKQIALDGSIAKAAQSLRLGVPTLSAQLKALEAQLGVVLFERRKQRLHLTETGQTVLSYARDIFKIGNEMVETVLDRRDPGRIHVQIGALDSIPKHLLLQLTRKALALGNCTVSILEGREDELMRELAQHRIDLLVSHRSHEGGSARGSFSRRIGRFPVLVCGTKKFRSLKKGFPESLEGAPFVLPLAGQGRTRGDIEHFFSRREIQIDLVAETQDLSVQKLLAINGIGLAVLPSPAARELLADRELIEIGQLEGVHDEFYLVAASRKIENPISSALMREFKIDN